MDIRDIYKTIETSESFVDWRGNLVEIGSTIVYAVSENSSAHMREAEVIGFKPGKTTVRCRTQTPHGERWISKEVPSYRLHVLPIRASDKWGPCKPSFVNNLDRVLAVD